MNTNRTVIFAAVGAMVALGVATYSLRLPASQAAQGQGDLSQAPLSLGGGVDPAFIMAVDDSGSMNWETLVANQDGELIWGQDDNSNTYGFFEDDGDLRNGGQGLRRNYLELFPFPGRGSKRQAVPPIPNFGFARSPEFNPAYFDPAVTYAPWKNHDGTSWKKMDTTAEWQAVKVDPRYGTSINGNWDSATFDLTSTVKKTGDDWEFDVETGMRLPRSVNYHRSANCDGYNNRDRWSGSPRSYDVTINDDGCEIAIEYFPATYYLSTPTSSDGSTGVEVTFTHGGPRSGTLYRYEIKPGNYATTAKYTAAMTNFANWFTYYRSRNLAMVAALTNSFDDVEEMRVGYFTINSGYKNNEYKSYSDVSMRDMSDEELDADGNYPASYERDELYADMLQLTATGSTPNRWASEHLGKQFMRTDADAPVQNACQVNAGMLFTDGYSNQGGPDVGEHDSGVASMFGSSASDSLADTAAKYYLANLRTGPDWLNQMPMDDACSGPNDTSKGLDCRNDPHMNFYGITLGAIGVRYGRSPYLNTAANPDGARDAAILTNPTWVAPVDDELSAVDEIWHATLNGRGKFVNASSPAAVTAAMREILASVGDGGGPSGSIAVTGARLGGTSLAVTPQFKAKGTNWYGDLIGAEVQFDSATGVLAYEEPHTWKASENLPEPSQREIFFATTTAGATVPTVKEFTATNLGGGAAALAALCANYGANTCSNGGTKTLADLGVSADNAVAYLRGETIANLRERGSPIGDIVNSTPIVSSPRDNYGYISLLGDDDITESDPYGYAEYLEDKQDRPIMVYVGANDGMLHGFIGLDDNSANEGKETFAYIPATAVGHMGNLLFPESPFFQHRYYVDGPVAVSDAWFGGSDWRTVLVGTAGAGGRSVFALDVSDATSFAADDVLWEVNDSVGGAIGQRIGHVLGKPVIVPVRAANGATSWKAIFGNGYGSDIGAGGTVTLFIVDVETGAVTTIDAKEADGPTADNGLGNIVALDRYRVEEGNFENGSDGFVDTVYGGDLHGNVWKFDLRDNTVAFDGVPLFTAMDANDKRQPITGGLEAALGPYGGVMVLFGTGSFSFTGDKQNTDVQSAYGIFDRCGTADTDACAAVTGARETSLQQRTLSASGTVSGAPPLNYFSLDGWYLDLAISGTDGQVKAGERMVGYPRLQGGTIFFPTYEPGSTDTCDGGGNDWLYGLNALTGGGDLASVRVGDPDADPAAEDTGRLELTNEGGMPIKDVAVYATPTLPPLGAGATQAEIEARLAQECDIIIQAAGGPPLYRWRACGRQSWRQVR